MKIELEFSKQRTIQSARLHLRTPLLTDAENVAACLNDFEVAKMLLHVPWPETLEGAIWWINQWLEGLQNGWCFAVNIKGQPNNLIGVVSAEPKGDGYEMGWWLNRSFWGRGYMTEAVEAVICECLRVEPDVQLRAGAINDNPASLRIQEKLGFEITGVEPAFCVSRHETVEVIRTQLSIRQVYFNSNQTGR